VTNCNDGNAVENVNRREGTTTAHVTSYFCGGFRWESFSPTRGFHRSSLSPGKPSLLKAQSVARHGNGQKGGL
jgi:hypothetical protein